MRGTRYGDFSRFADPADDQRTVLMQQGRVQLDSDWNSQVVLGERALRSAVADLIGGSGAPASDPGFGIVARGALEFGGDAALVVDEDAGPLLPGRYDPFTVELWLEWRGGSGVVLRCTAADGEGGHELVVDDDGSLTWWIIRGPSGAPPAQIHAPGALDPMTPTHVALVFHGDSAAIHGDGPELARGRVVDPEPVEEGTISVGGAADDSAAGFRGLLQGIRFWSTYRSPAELRASRLQPRGQATDEGLLAWWRLDEAGASTLTDVGGLTARLHGHHRPHWRLVDLSIEPGRFWVDGVACELDQPRSFRRQPCADPSPLPERGTHLLYLEVWEESVSAVQDPSLREVALGGLDTTVRTRVVSCVRMTPVDGDRERNAGVGEALESGGRGTTGRMTAEHSGEADPGNFLYRVEVHQGGRVARRRPGDFETEVVSIETDTWELRLADPWPDLDPGSEIVVIGIDLAGNETPFRHRVAAVHEGGRRVQLSSDPADILMFDSHRVRSHAPAPTFKWSRRNGADVFAVAPVQARAKVLELLPGGPAVPPLQAGDVVELLDEAGSLRGPVSPLLRVREVREQDGTVELSDAVSPGVGGRHPFLRRWDQRAATDDFAEPISGDWTELEDGIRVRFEPGAYRSGDYWWIVARQEQRSIEWPREHGHPQPARAEGVERRVAPLALLRVGDGRFEVEDLRRRIGDGAAEHRPSRPEPPSDEPEWPRPDDDSGDADGDGDANDDGSANADANGNGAIDGNGDAEANGDADGDGEANGDGDDMPGEPVWPAGLREFAVIAPAGASIPGFIATGIEVETKPYWRPIGVLDVAAHELRALASIGRTILLATAEELWGIYSESGSASRLTNLPDGRRGFTGCAVGDVLLLFGGRPGRGRPDGRVLAFDTGRGTWSERARMPKRLEHTAAVVRAGRVHVMGGSGGAVFRRAATAHHHVYDPQSDRWAKARRLPKRRSGAAAATVDGRVHVLGGTGGVLRHRPLSSQHVHGADGVWREAAPLPVHGRPALGSAAGHGRHIVLVDAAWGEPQSLLAYDHAARSWESLPPLPGGAAAHALAPHGNGFVAAARNDDGATVLHHLSIPSSWTLFAPETVLARSRERPR